MKVLVSGSRDWATPVHARVIRSVLMEYLRRPGVVIHGDARGVDRMAATIAAQLGHAVRAYPADWITGLSAGPQRNQRMLDENPDIELALIFHDHLPKSKGSRDMARRAVLADLPTWVFDAYGRRWAATLDNGFVLKSQF